MMSVEEVRLEVALRVFAARFVTDDRVDPANASFAAKLAWEAADLFVKEMKGRAAQEEVGK
jgi:hypothetical protein